MVSNKSDQIHIAIAIDHNYVVPFYVLLTSLFLNNQHHQFAIHSIMTKVSESEKDSMTAYTKQHNATLHFYEIDALNIADLPLIPNYPGFTIAVYYRLFFPMLIPEHLTKVLYLDTDTIIIGDLSEFFKIDLDTFILAAAEETEMEIRADLGIYRKKDYFNSGVMLINLQAWRKEKITEKCLKFLRENPEKIKFVDQDALNVVLKNKWLRINVKYNLMAIDVPKEISKRKLTIFLKEIRIVHFNHYKPWSGLCKNRLKYLYRYYLKLSPKAAEQRKYTDFSIKPSYLFHFIRIRIVKFYLVIPIFPTLWRKIKSL